LARPTSRYISFDGENISFASLVIYINSTNILGSGVAWWLGRCAAGREVPGSIPGCVAGDSSVAPDEAVCPGVGLASGGGCQGFLLGIGAAGA